MFRCGTYIMYNCMEAIGFLVESHPGFANYRIETCGRIFKFKSVYSYVCLLNYVLLHRFLSIK